jgi:hypothetical protein
MALRKEFVAILADRVSEELVERALIELPRDFSITEHVFEAIQEEVTVEDRLNDEVRTMLNEYSDQMRESGASYQEMFKLIKKKLARERKLVL